MEFDCHTMLYNIPNEDEQDKHRFEIEANRDKFWKDYNDKSFADVVALYMMPEKIRWNISFLQKHKNSDLMLLFMKFFRIPIWILKKVFSFFKKGKQ